MPISKPAVWAAATEPEPDSRGRGARFAQPVAAANCDNLGPVSHPFDRELPFFLDTSAWSRRRQLEFFQGYDRPFFNLCAPVEVTGLRELCRRSGHSFFLASHYLALRAANAVPEFRYRLRGDRVLVHPRVHGGSTVLRDDETFTFAYFDYTDDFASFVEAAAPELERLKTGPAPFDPQDERDDLIHFSVIPWVAFTSFQHARRTNPEDSVPKIVFGKVYEDRVFDGDDPEGRKVERMPVSVEVHHALMDGLHAGRFFSELEGEYRKPKL